MKRLFYIGLFGLGLVIGKGSNGLDVIRSDDKVTILKLTDSDGVCYIARSTITHFPQPSISCLKYTSVGR